MCRSIRNQRYPPSQTEGKGKPNKGKRKPEESARGEGSQSLASETGTKKISWSNQKWPNKYGDCECYPCETEQETSKLEARSYLMHENMASDDLGEAKPAPCWSRKPPDQEQMPVSAEFGDCSTCKLSLDLIQKDNGKLVIVQPKQHAKGGNKPREVIPRLGARRPEMLEVDAVRRKKRPSKEEEVLLRNETSKLRTEAARLRAVTNQLTH